MWKKIPQKMDKVAHISIRESDLAEKPVVFAFYNIF